uniref:phasin family protein n=1 Tax=Pararhizobium sp. IMCC3301 TaxID=3067904 RepID=UPI0027415858|nr:phasin family protein [Pararhizobium sp. IMCC3301]
MPDTQSSKMPVSTPPSPAVLRFRGLDLQAMTELQLRNIDAIRQMVELIFDSARTITERQVAFFNTAAKKTAAASGRSDVLLDPTAIFERQNEAYRELFGALADQAGELAEVTSKCCTAVMHDASPITDDIAKGETPDGTVNHAGCCGGKGKKVAAKPEKNKTGSAAAKTAAKQPDKPGTTVAAGKAADGYKPHPVL